MSLVFWIWLEGFYVATADGADLVVREGIILDATKAAKQKGLVPGMELRQAKAIQPNITFQKWRREEYEQREKAWLDLCVDFTGVIEPEDQHSAFLDLSLHPKPIDVAEKLVRTLVDKTGLQVRYGLAPSKWMARLAEMREDLGKAAQDPVGFLQDLPVDDLLPIPLEHRQRLRFLGYRKIGELAQIPFEVLQGQFGEEAYSITQAARGALYEEVQALYPMGALRDSFVFDGAVESLEILTSATKLLAKRIGDRLESKSLEGAKFKLTIEDEDGEIIARGKKFSKPVRCPRTALAALRILLEEPFEKPITALRVAIDDLKRVKSYQAELLPGRERYRQVDGTLRHIRTAYGDLSIQKGSDIQLPRRILVLREWKNATGWR